MTINIKEAQHPLKREKQVIDKSSIMLKISTKSMHRELSILSFFRADNYAAAKEIVAASSKCFRVGGNQGIVTGLKS